MCLLIGYGNPLRGDDRLGWYLAEIFEHRGQVIICTQLTPELAEPMSRAEQVIFIDARVGDTAGEVISEKVVPLPTSGAFTHHVTPASLLAASHELYGALPPALLISVTGVSFEYGRDFSPSIQIRLPEITKHVDEAIKFFQGTTSVQLKRSIHD
jgi:hydrogenase maturation protease